MSIDPVGPNIPGVHSLDHAADVGLELEGPTLVELLRRAALGLSWLLFERALTGEAFERPLRVAAESPPALLRELLRALLWWHDSEGASPVDLREARVDEENGLITLAARAVLSCDPGVPAREIKGVTLHGLLAERSGPGWCGRVIFDV